MRKDLLRILHESDVGALDPSGIAHAGAGRTLAEAHQPGTKRVQGRKDRLALLSYMRYWTDRDRCAVPSGG